MSNDLTSDSVVLARWSASDPTSKCHAVYAKRVCAIRDYMNADNISAAVSSPLGPVAVVQKWPRYQAQKGALCAVLSLLRAVPELISDPDRLSAWPDLWEVYKADPERGAACALIPAMHGGDANAYHVSQCLLDNRERASALRSAAAASTHHGGGQAPEARELPWQPYPELRETMSVLDEPDRILLNSPNSPNSPKSSRSETQAAKKSRRKRANRRMRRASTPVCATIATAVNALRERWLMRAPMKTPLAIESVHWRFIADCWRDNCVSLAEMRGELVVFDTPSGLAFASVLSLLLGRVSGPDATRAVNPRKPARARNSAPFVSATFTTRSAGSAVEVKKTMQSRSGGTWKNGIAEMTPLSSNAQHTTDGPTRLIDGVSPVCDYMHTTRFPRVDLEYTDFLATCTVASLFDTVAEPARMLTSAISASAAVYGPRAVPKLVYALYQTGETGMLDTHARRACLARVLSRASEDLATLQCATLQCADGPADLWELCVEDWDKDDFVTFRRGGSSAPVSTLRGSDAARVALVMRAAFADYRLEGHDTNLLLVWPSALGVGERGMVDYLRALLQRDPLRTVAVIGGNDTMAAAGDRHVCMSATPCGEKRVVAGGELTGMAAGCS